MSGESMRKPLFLIALALLVAVVLVEVGQAWVLAALPAPSRTETLDQLPPELRGDAGSVGDLPAGSPPGWAIRALALLDGILLFTVGLIAVGLAVTPAVLGRIQGVGTLVFSIVVVLAAIASFLALLALVILMVSLLLSVPFGTIVYLAVFGHFNRGAASVVLGVLMLLKLGFAGCLVVAYPRFLQNKGLVLLLICSLVANVIISFLHGIVPGFLVSITDGIAAIIVVVLALLWAIVLLIGSIPAIIMAIRAGAG
jgi:hypothetical protein